MKTKNLVFSLLMSIAFVLPMSASIGDNESKFPEKAQTEINQLVSKIDFDVDALNSEKVKMYFIVNVKNEIVILKTNNENVDATLKNNLNYKALKSTDLEINKVYILPISFEKK